MRRTAGVLVGLVVALGAAGAANAGIPGYNVVTPVDGSTITLDADDRWSMIPFEMHTPGCNGLRVEVATSPLAGKDGTLADDFFAGGFFFRESDAFPGVCRSGFGHYGRSGTLYFQVYASTVSWDFRAGPVQSFTIARRAAQALPAPPPSPSPPQRPASVYVDPVSPAQANRCRRALTRQSNARRAFNAKRRAFRRHRTVRRKRAMNRAKRQLRIARRTLHRAC